jgi:hypothetical protein
MANKAQADTIMMNGIIPAPGKLTTPFAHKNLWAVYIYSNDGTEVARFRVFADEIEAHCWMNESPNPCRACFIFTRPAPK